MTFTFEFPRDRDVYVLEKGDAYPCSISQNMIQNGWQGGQGVRWIDSDIDEFLVDYSDGTYGGFLLWGSNESSDQFTSMTGNQPLYGTAVFCGGSWLIATRTFEVYTWESRQVGPLVPLVYPVGARILFSLRGLFTTEDEWSPSGDPRAPNTYYIGNIVQTPVAANNNYLVLQTSI